MRLVQTGRAELTPSPPDWFRLTDQFKVKVSLTAVTSADKFI